MNVMAVECERFIYLLIGDNHSAKNNTKQTTQKSFCDELDRYPITIQISLITSTYHTKQGIVIIQLA